MTNKDLLYSTGNTVECNVADLIGREFEGEGSHAYVWLSAFSDYLKLAQQC